MIAPLGAWSIRKERNNLVLNQFNRTWLEVVAAMAREATLSLEAFPAFVAGVATLVL